MKMRSVIFHNKRICDISANTQISIYTKYNREIKLQCTSDIYYLQRHIIITIKYHTYTVRSEAEFIYIFKNERERAKIHQRYVIMPINHVLWDFAKQIFGDCM